MTQIEDPGDGKLTRDERWEERAKKWGRPKNKKDREEQRKQRILDAGGVP